MRRENILPVLRTSDITAFLFVVLVAAAVFARPLFVDLSEDIMYALHPSPERAFAYGERHFSAGDVAEYDIVRAGYFFNEAAKKDPTIPYLYHELARIDFLRGDFTAALARINFQISMQGDKTPNSYYVRGLIEGYMGDYDASAKDYEHFLKFDPNNWAALNDYAWVLLKADRPGDAAEAAEKGLALFPNNAWLLNTDATALYETHDYADRRASPSTSSTRG